MRPTPRILLPFLACSAFYTASSAQQQPQLTPEQLQARDEGLKQREEFRARQAQIRAEIADIKAGKIEPGAEWANEWVGEYSVNLGYFFLTITVAPRGGMCYSTISSLGTLLDYNYGRIVESTRDTVLVRPERPISTLSSDFLSDQLYFVRWGELRLLLSQPKLIALISSFRERTQPSTLNLLVAESNPPFWLARRFPEERPQVPEQFEPLFSSPAIAARVTDVQLQDLGDCVLNGIRTDYYTVSFDKGRLERVQSRSAIITPSLRGNVGEMTISDHATTASVIVKSGPDFRVRSAPQVGDTWYILLPPDAPQTEP